MSRHMMFISLVVSLGLLTATLSAAEPQKVRGKALYELMGKGGLTTTSGSGSLDWLPDGSGYLVQEKDAKTKQTRFFRVDSITEKKTPLFDDETTEAIRGEYRRLSGHDGAGLPMERFRFVREGKAIRFSARQQSYLFDLDSRTMRRLAPGPGTYSPDCANRAYVKDNDLYLADAETGKERPLTTGGSTDLLNGRADWAYVEEFRQREAFWWSPDGHSIAYLQFDERAVQKYPLVRDLTPQATLEQQSYPKAGATLPTVRLFVVDVRSGNSIEMETHTSDQVYIVGPQWRPDGSEITFQRLNRRQNELDLMAADPESGKSRVLFREREEAWITLPGGPVFLQDGQRLVWSSERSGWRHLYLYDLQGRQQKQLTSGRWPVDRILRVDEKSGYVYFTGGDGTALETHFFRVKLDGSAFEQLTQQPGSHSVSLDPSCRFYTDSFSSFAVPPTVNLHAADAALLRNLSTTNTEKLDELDLEPPELTTVKAADGKTDLHGLLFKPAGYDPNQKYPLLVLVYGGPESKSVHNRYSMTAAGQRMAQLGFMVWTMDNRGLRNRGKRFETATYQKLGQVDLADQTAGVRQITERPYVDGSRVGICGGSYGGYMTCLAMLKEPDVFHVGVAASSVTDWRSYDALYTERYMRTPEENQQGYERGSTLPCAKELRGKLLLIHGTIDDNVHPGNTIQLVDRLIQENKQFDLMFYPGRRHGIGGSHVETLRLQYFLKHLRPPEYTPEE
ncbi:MAG: hypothetical protein A2V70_12550 [Planctomycetes bacterium RBG_13_63_9]|nr:MAG: hypothetical protein A2V70_12550 [Planctomycetes bacterium RBG_13_63_9]